MTFDDLMIGGYKATFKLMHLSNDKIKEVLKDVPQSKIDNLPQYIQDILFLRVYQDELYFAHTLADLEEYIDVDEWDNEDYDELKYSVEHLDEQEVVAFWKEDFDTFRILGSV